MKIIISKRKMKKATPLKPGHAYSVKVFGNGQFMWRNDTNKTWWIKELK